MKINPFLALTATSGSFLPTTTTAFLHSPLANQPLAIHSRYPTDRIALRAAIPPSSSSSSPETEPETTLNKNKNDDVIKKFTSFGNAVLSDIDNSNTPPNLQTILTSFEELKSGSDLRGVYVPHKHSGGTIANISLLVKDLKQNGGGGVALTPFASHCFGVAFANKLLSSKDDAKLFGEEDGKGKREGDAITVCIGRDPRPHGERLADAFARGVESVEGVRVLYTGLASTPSMYEFCRSGQCDAAVMVTASHLPEEKNGLKFFTKNGGLTKSDMDELIDLAQAEAHHWYDLGIVPPSSGNAGVLCSELVDFMPYYKETLKNAILREVGTSSSTPLAGLKIVVNPGNGAGCFFNDLLRELGADVSASIHLTPDGTFPKSSGVPNPEKQVMVDETTRACELAMADIGVMFDTDADRAGFVLPRNIDYNGAKSDYEPLNKNRLIALLSVVFSATSPGCTIVTDSTTSEGLNKFLEGDLGLKHFRYLRGYANVIGKAKELTESGQANAEVAIETSGHCAMKENGYIDDGTYTAVKILGLLARTTVSGSCSLLDLIANLEEMPFDQEYRVNIVDGSLETTTAIFKDVAQKLLEQCSTENGLCFDEQNLEGVRFRLASGGFFMIRQSLHDPVISVQVESISKDEAETKVLKPLLALFSEHESAVDISSMK